MKAPRLSGCAVPSLILFLSSSFSQVHFAAWCLSDFCVESGVLQRGISAGQREARKPPFPPREKKMCVSCTFPS